MRSPHGQMFFSPTVGLSCHSNQTIKDIISKGVWGLYEQKGYSAHPMRITILQNIFILHNSSVAQKADLRKMKKTNLYIDGWLTHTFDAVVLASPVAGPGPHAAGPPTAACYSQVESSDF